MIHTHKTRPAIQQPTPQFTPPQTPRGEATFTAEGLSAAMGPKVLTRPGR